MKKQMYKLGHRDTIEGLLLNYSDSPRQVNVGRLAPGRAEQHP